MTRRSRAWAIGAVALTAVAVGLVLLVRQWESLALPGAEPLMIDDASPGHLDTLAFRRRPVIASLSGVVQQIGPEETVWLQSHGDAFPVAFSEAPDLEVEDRALVVGRLKGWGGQRWLDVESWSRVETSMR